MDIQTINFTASEQTLTKTAGARYFASHTVSYIEAVFALGENWTGWDSVRAIWYSPGQKIATVLDSSGACMVPTEVIAQRGIVRVNLVASTVENDVVTDRLTTYPAIALIVDADARITGTETTAVTPSQFEQFVAAVHDDAEDVRNMSATAETLPAGSSASASYNNGLLTLGIPQGQEPIELRVLNPICPVDVKKSYPMGAESNTVLNSFNHVVQFSFWRGGQRLSGIESVEGGSAVPGMALGPLGLYVYDENNEVIGYTLTYQFSAGRAVNLSQFASKGEQLIKLTLDGKVYETTLYFYPVVQGIKGADGTTPVKGTDYWTDADKAEIVADVLDALPTWQGGDY